MRYVMLHYRKDENDAKACPEISEVYGENTVGERRNREWFARFHSKNLNVKNAPRFGWLFTGKVDKIIQMVEQHASFQG